jgi:predicted nucleic acid-binding protein
VAIGLDTSVVLRLLIGEPRAQAEIVRRRIERALIAGEKVIRALGATTATFDRRQARLEGGVLLRA